MKEQQTVHFGSRHENGNIFWILGEFQSREDALDAIHTGNYPVRGPQMSRKGFDLK